MKKSLAAVTLIALLGSAAQLVAQEPSGNNRIHAALADLDATARRFACEPRAIELGEQALRITTELDRAVQTRTVLSELDETLLAELQLRLTELNIDDAALAEAASLEVAGQYVDGMATIASNIAGIDQSVPRLEAALVQVRSALLVHNGTCGRVAVDVPGFVAPGDVLVTTGEFGPVEPHVAAAREALLRRARGEAPPAPDNAPAPAPAPSTGHGNVVTVPPLPATTEGSGGN